MNDRYAQGSNILRDAEEDRMERKKVDQWIFILLLFIIAVIPMIVMASQTDVISPLVTELGVLTSGIKGDVFSHYKFVALIIFTVIVTLMFLYKYFFLSYVIPKRPILLFIFIFIVGILLSAMVSPNKTIALYGVFNRRDGTLSYLCYTVLLFIAMHINYPQKAIHYILYALYPFVLVNFTLSLMNFTGNDALKSEFVQKAVSLFLSGDAQINASSLLLGTLNQWNYMSGMFAVIVVMYLTAMLIDTNLIRRISHLIIAIISFSIVLMSLSTSGFLTILVLTPFLLWFVLRNSSKKVAAFLIIGFLFLCIPTMHLLATKNPRVWDESVGLLIKSNPYVKQVPVVEAAWKRNWEIALIPQAYAAEKEKFELPIIPEAGVSPGSGRLYIWEKTIDLTMDRFLVGYGLDTIMYQFPQNDIDKIAGLGTKDIMVDKPHNLYIGIFYGAGIIGLIGFLGIIAMTLKEIGQAMIKFGRQNELSLVFGLAWIAYLVQAFFNDNIVGIATPLWVLVGIMLAMMYEKHSETEKN